VRSINRNVVRLGIDAPGSIPILRAEIANESAPAMQPEPKLSHKLRNRLHTASLAIHLAQKQLSAGLENHATQTLESALREFTAVEEELAAAQDMSRRTIQALLVEDNCNESTLLAEFLRLHGIAVVTACDGQDALDYLQQHSRPDVVLLDMRMPRCDGPATVAAIRNNAAFNGLKVFAVSGADPGNAPSNRAAAASTAGSRSPSIPPRSFMK
jgi:CheY-like chemotaxis protein